MTEARYRGQKVVVVSPDYSDHTKFADDWLPAHPGTDGALAMAMGHVILTEFFRDRQVPYFTEYVKTYTDLPFLVTLEERGDAYVPGRFLTAADLGDDGEGAAHKTIVLDAADRGTRRPERIPRLPLHRGRAGPVEPRPRRNRPGADRATAGTADAVPVDLPRFDIGQTEGGRVVRRGVPAIRFGDRLVTTVFDLLMAQYGVGRDGLPGRLAVRLRRRGGAGHPGLAGGDHLRAGRGGGPGGPGVRPQRRAVQGPVDDLHGGRNQPLVPLRPDLPHVLHA